MNYKKVLIIMIFVSCLQAVNPLIASKGAPAKVSPAPKSKPSYYEQAKTTIGSFSPFSNSATSQMSSAQKANATSSSNTKSREQSLNQKASTLTGVKQSYEQVKAKAVSYYQQAKAKTGSLLLGKTTATTSTPVVPVENQALNSQTNPLHEKSTPIDLSALSSSTSSQQSQNVQKLQEISKKMTELKENLGKLSKAENNIKVNHQEYLAILKEQPQIKETSSVIQKYKESAKQFELLKEQTKQQTAELIKLSESVQQVNGEGIQSKIMSSNSPQTATIPTQNKTANPMRIKSEQSLQNVKDAFTNMSKPNNQKTSTTINQDGTKTTTETTIGLKNTKPDSHQTTKVVTEQTKNLTGETLSTSKDIFIDISPSGSAIF